MPKQEMVETEVCDGCCALILEYKGCDLCGDILCKNCAVNDEGIAYCEECHIEYKEEQERDNDF